RALRGLRGHRRRQGPRALQGLRRLRALPVGGRRRSVHAGAARAERSVQGAARCVALRAVHPVHEPRRVRPRGLLGAGPAHREARGSGPVARGPRLPADPRGPRDAQRGSDAVPRPGRGGRTHLPRPAAAPDPVLHVREAAILTSTREETPSMHRILRFAALALITVAAAIPAGAQSLTGAGATFPYPIYSKWFDAYHKQTGVSINYQSIGSGAGIQQV